MWSQNAFMQHSQLQRLDKSAPYLQLSELSSARTTKEFHRNRNPDTDETLSDFRLFSFYFKSLKMKINDTSPALWEISYHHDGIVYVEALVNKLMPLCAWLLSSALEILRLRLGLRLR